MPNTFNKALAVFALGLACAASASGFASEDRYPAAVIQPIVVPQGGARAIGRLGFRYENGFGVPQNYIAAADIYRRAIDIVGRPAEHVLFVDDREGNTEAAIKAGMQAIQFTNDEQLRKDLRQLEIL